MEKSELKQIIREEIILYEKSLYRDSRFKKIMNYVWKIKKNLNVMSPKYQNDILKSLAKIEFIIDQEGIAREED